MSETTASLRHQIDSAAGLQSVVRTMKAMAASSIGQYEGAVHALEGYDHSVQLALSACFRPGVPAAADLSAHPPGGRTGNAPRIAVVFGSDQGLVGQFNDALADLVHDHLAPLNGPTTVWTVGERMRARLEDGDWPLGLHFALPGSLAGITPLVSQVLVALETQREHETTWQDAQMAPVLLFHNQPMEGAAYVPHCQRLLPLDSAWQRKLAAMPWPSRQWPEVVNAGPATLLAFVREYLFVSLFRACAQSLASENASRLAAMQRAEKNIDELLEGLTQGYHRLRQSSIDEELFDLVAGFEALSPPD
jgi:F-type H+-transporting ATPase subunit gamma